jgi:putative ABC transport system substrate-binding protein
MRRRDFIAALAAAAAPRLAQAQQYSLPIVGCLAAPAEANYLHHVTAIREGLREFGFVDGQNVAL